MDHLIDLIGRDTFFAIVVFIGSVIRAGKGEKMPITQGLIAAFVPFFCIVCILYIFEWGMALLGLVPPAKVLGAFGGIFAYLGNSWLAGLQKDGRKIEKAGAAGSLVAIVKSTVNFTKPD